MGILCVCVRACIVQVYITPPYPERTEAIDTVVAQMHCSQTPRRSRRGIARERARARARERERERGGSRCWQWRRQGQGHTHTHTHTQRRKVMLAVVSPMIGAAAFANSRISPTDPVTVLRGVEARSPSLQVYAPYGYMCDLYMDVCVSYTWMYVCLCVLLPI